MNRLKGTSSSHPVHYEGIEGSNDGGGGNDQIRIGEPEDATGRETGIGGVPDVFTVDDAVEYLGFGKFQLLLALLTGLAWMADAMEIMILSILSPALYCEWAITPMQQVGAGRVFWSICLVNLGNLYKI